jgi:hypothetical protein
MMQMLCFKWRVKLYMSLLAQFVTQEANFSDKALESSSISKYFQSVFLKHSMLSAFAANTVKPVTSSGWF